MSRPIIWLDRGDALHGGVTVRTVWQYLDGAYRRTQADALIVLPHLTRFVRLHPADA